MYKKKKKLRVEEEKIKLDLDPDLVLKTPVATPFRVPIPGHSGGFINFCFNILNKF